jgi:hypothetical protein
LSKVDSIISELEQQRQAIDRAIEALREIGAGREPAKRRGRPPGKKTRGGKRNMSPEGRARIAEAARKRWAELRASRAGATKKTPRKKATAKKREPKPAVEAAGA